MKTILLSTAIMAIMASTSWAQQRTPPAIPPGMKVEQAEAEILKGNEVIVSDDMAMTSKQVGEKIKFTVFRQETAAGTIKINMLKFTVTGFGLSQK